MTILSLSLLSLILLLFVMTTLPLSSSSSWPAEQTMPSTGTRRWRFLSHDWSAGEANLFSSLSREMHASQRRCEKTSWWTPLNNGMGSDLHVWSQALCNAMQNGISLVQPKRFGRDWIWADPAFCRYDRPRKESGRAYFDCYFNEGNTCNLTTEEEDFMLETSKQMSVDNGFDACPRYITDMESRFHFRKAAMEYLFSDLSPSLVAAADEAAGAVFLEMDIPRDKLITVHVRWGNKMFEMKLVSLEEYMEALRRIVKVHNIDTPYVYLTTETFEAYHAFAKELDKEAYANWTLLNHRPSLAVKGGISGFQLRNESQFSAWHRSQRQSHRVLRSSDTSKHSRDRGVRAAAKGGEKKRRPRRRFFVRENEEHLPDPLLRRKGGAFRKVSPDSLARRGSKTLGRHSLVSLLVALEARHFVLTSGSNWSRLINELRVGVLEASCRRSSSRECTTMVDLMKGDTPDWR